MTVLIEIETLDRGLQFDLFGTRELEPNKTATDIPGGARLELGTVSFQKGVGFPEIIHAILVFGAGASTGLVANWLYDKLKGRAAVVRINRVEVTVDKGEIKRLLVEQIEVKK